MSARRTPGLTLALALLVVLELGVAPARAEELTPGELVRELERAHKAVESELASSREGHGIDVERLRRETARLGGVQVGTGHGPVDADPGIARDLSALDEVDSPSVREEKLEDLSHRLDGIEHEARRALKRAPRSPSPSERDPTTDASSPPSERPSADDARKALGRVLDRPHYRRRTAAEAESSGLSDKLESWSQRALNWLERWLQPGAPWQWPAWMQSVFDFFKALLPTTWTGVAVWVTVFVLLVVLFVFWRLRRRAFSQPEEDQGGFDGEREVERPAPEESFSEAHWRREARLLAERGDHRGAVRALYTGLLLVLQRGGLLKFDKGKTNWEHLRELRRNDRTLAARLEPLTRLFDVARYGRATVEAATYDDFLSRSDELSRAVEGPGGGRAAP